MCGGGSDGGDDHAGDDGDEDDVHCYSTVVINPDNQTQIMWPALGPLERKTLDSILHPNKKHNLNRSG